MERKDAIIIGAGAERRSFVPTSDATIWISSWEEFKASGGVCCYAEDQATIELQLPEPYKFSIQFFRQGGKLT